MERKYQIWSEGLFNLTKKGITRSNGRELKPGDFKLELGTNLNQIDEVDCPRIISVCLSGRCTLVKPEFLAQYKDN